jgi:hypothetical protein
MRHFQGLSPLSIIADSTHILCLSATLLPNRLRPKAVWKIGYAQAFRILSLILLATNERAPACPLSMSASLLESFVNSISCIMMQRSYI